jgi:cadmium resistance protein CadD (predicted permease)
MLLTIALGIGLFVSTNVDDIVILVAFFADPTLRPRQVVVGQLLGMAALIGVSAGGALLALVAPRAWIGLLGFVPLALGIAKLVRRRRADPDEPRPAGARGVLAVAAVTVANGGDNVGVYVPAFAVQTPPHVALLALTFLALTALWCLLAFRLVSHPQLGAPPRRWAGVALPYVLIALGLFILASSGALRLLLRCC